MTEHALSPFNLTSTRIGRTDLGAGVATVDDDTLCVTVLAADEHALRIPLSAIDAVTADRAEVTLSLRDGMRLTLGGDDPTALRDAIVAHCRAIPEVTRALRAFGSRRGHASSRGSGPSEQQRFFAPLLDARKAALTASVAESVIAAFDSRALERAIDQTIHAFAEERHGTNAPARRALEAELVDLTDPLRNALATLDDSAHIATTSLENLVNWRAWSAQLRATFETADRVWLSIDAALDSNPWRA